MGGYFSPALRWLFGRLGRAPIPPAAGAPVAAVFLARPCEVEFLAATGTAEFLARPGDTGFLALSEG